MKQVRLASVLGLIVSLFGVVALLGSEALAGSITSTTTNSTGTYTTTTLQFPWVLAAALVVSVVIGIAMLLLMRSAFRTLETVAGPFSTPAKLALVALIGYLIVGLGGVLFYAGIQEAASCASAAGTSTTCLFNGALVGGIALLLIGGIVALVGLIGILIGIWRLGTRYDKAVFKAAAILLIFPYLSVIGYILVLVGSVQALGDLQGRR